MVLKTTPQTNLVLARHWAFDLTALKVLKSMMYSSITKFIQVVRQITKPSHLAVWYCCRLGDQTVTIRNDNSLRELMWIHLFFIYLYMCTHTCRGTHHWRVCPSTSIKCTRTNGHVTSSTYYEYCLKKLVIDDPQIIKEMTIDHTHATDNASNILDHKTMHDHWYFHKT